VLGQNPGLAWQRSGRSAQLQGFLQAHRGDFIRKASSHGNTFYHRCVHPVCMPVSHGWKAVMHFHTHAITPKSQPTESAEPLHIYTCGSSGSSTAYSFLFGVLEALSMPLARQKYACMPTQDPAEAEQDMDRRRAAWQKFVFAAADGLGEPDNQLVKAEDRPDVHAGYHTLSTVLLLVRTLPLHLERVKLGVVQLDSALLPASSFFVQHGSKHGKLLPQADCLACAEGSG
jgi:hypothetical protein